MWNNWRNKSSHNVLEFPEGMMGDTMFRTQAKKIITILTFTRFSGKGRHQLHYEKSQNANFLALISINTVVLPATKLSFELHIL